MTDLSAAFCLLASNAINPSKHLAHLMFTCNERFRNGGGMGRLRTFCLSKSGYIDGTTVWNSSLHSPYRLWRIQFRSCCHLLPWIGHYLGVIRTQCSTAKRASLKTYADNSWRSKSTDCWLRSSLKLWAESISTMVYLRTRSPSSAIQDKAATPFQAWHKSDPPAIGHIRIFGCTAYVFDEVKPKTKLASKSWTGYLVGYEGHHQYRIYDPAWQAVYIRCDVIFDENVVGPARVLPTSDTFGNTALVDLYFPTISLPRILWLSGEDETAPILEPAIPAESSIAKSILQANDVDTSSELSDLTTLMRTFQSNPTRQIFPYQPNEISSLKNTACVFFFFILPV